MMQIILNGQTRQVNEHCTLEELIASLELTGGRLAVEVNRQIVPRSEYRSHILAPGDQVEVVQAIGGGS